MKKNYVTVELEFTRYMVEEVLAASIDGYDADGETLVTWDKVFG